MNMKKSKSRYAFEIINAVFMLFLVVVTLYPILYIVFASFSNSDMFAAHRGLLLKPIGFTALAYERAFKHPLILTSYVNTLFVVSAGTCINLLLTSLGAYFLAQKGMMWRKPIALGIIFTMFFSGGMIPAYLNVQSLGLYDTRWALILPGAVSTYNLIIMRTGFAAVPRSLSESAYVDGAGHFRVLFRIMVPLCMPTIAVMILYYGVGHWNSWFSASIYLRDMTKIPLQLVLRQILVANNTENMTIGIDTGEILSISETIKYAVIVIATLPVLCIYPFLQKYFVKGVMIGAVKE